MSPPLPSKRECLHSKELGPRGNLTVKVRAEGMSQVSCLGQELQSRSQQQTGCSLDMKQRLKLGETCGRGSARMLQPLGTEDKGAAQ